MKYLSSRIVGGKFRSMTSFKYAAVLGLLLLVPLAYSQAAVAVGIGVGPVGFGVGSGYVGEAPVCPYGYYPDYPYACAPYGYYGADWFAGGVFIGAGPWYHGWGHPFYRQYSYGGRFYGRPGGYERGREVARGFTGRDGGRGFEHGSGGRPAEHGPVAVNRGAGFHDGGGSRGGRR